MQNSEETNTSAQSNQLAPLTQRFVSTIIDLVPVTVLMIPILAITSKPSEGYLIGSVVFLGYYTVLEARYGYTLGKRFNDLIVVRHDGSEIGWKESVIRNLLRIVDSLPNFYLLGFAVAIWSEDKQRIGDMAADTIVKKSE
jgi:uncharacterized RDD family membrane protein YckC